MTLIKTWPVDRATGRGRFIFDPGSGSGTGGGGGGGGGTHGRLGDPGPGGTPLFPSGLSGNGAGLPGSGGDGGDRIVVLSGSTLVDPRTLDIAYSGVSPAVAEYDLFGVTEVLDNKTTFTRTDFLDFVTFGGPSDGAVFRAAAVENDFHIYDIFLHEPIFLGGQWKSMLADPNFFYNEDEAPALFEHWVDSYTNLAAVPASFIITRQVVFGNRDLQFPNAGQWSSWDYAANKVIPVASDNNTVGTTWDKWGFGGHLATETIPTRYFSDWYKIFDFGDKQDQYINDYDFHEDTGNPDDDYNDGLGGRTITVYNRDALLIAGEPEVYTSDSLLNPTDDRVLEVTQTMRLECYHSNVVFIDNGTGLLTVHNPDDESNIADPIWSYDVSTAWTASGRLFAFDEKGMK